MRALERRQAIIELLCERRSETIANLMFEFNACYNTILNDIQELSLIYPIYTKCGKHDGGVYIDEDYYLGKQYLSETQISVLNKLIPTLEGEDRKALESIIKKFGRK